MSTYNELAAAVRQAEEANRKIEELRGQALEDLKTAIVEMIAATPFTRTEVLSSLLPAGTGTKRARKPRSESGDKRKRPVAPKYAHPVTGQTWTGRGKRPAWVLDEYKLTKEQIDAIIAKGVKEIRVKATPAQERAINEQFAASGSVEAVSE